MFGHVGYSTYITPTVNFKTFGSSLCLLFRVATAAGWNGVLEGLCIEEPHCNPNKFIPGGGGGVAKGDCGNKIAAVIYLVSYMFIIVQFIVNMYIAVILENFNDAQNQESVGITEDAIEDFYETWKKYDPKAKQFMEYKDVSDFLDEVPRPFRKVKPNSEYIARLNCPVREGRKVHCLDLLQALIKQIIGEDKCKLDEADAMVAKLMGKVEKKLKKQFPVREKKGVVETTTQRVEIEDAASRRIQKLARWFIIQSNVEMIKDTDIEEYERNRRIRRIENAVKGLVKMNELEKERQKKKEEEEQLRRKELFDSDDEEYMMETPLL